MAGRIVLVFILLLLPACGASDADTGAGEEISVMAALYPLAFAAEEIGGDRVAVTNVTPPGTEPHDVELSARDVERIRSADLVLYLGDGFQPALERAVASADVAAIDLLEVVGVREVEGDEKRVDEERAVDPHVWLDPLRYAKMVARIGEELGRREAAATLAARLHAMHAEFEEGLASCERRQIVTSHAAFGYLAERYDLDQIAISGLAPEVEPTPRELEEVIAEVRHGATTIFFETLVSPRLAETVARETGARAAVLDPIEGLTREQLENGEDYFSIMRRNLEALRSALGCE